MISGLATRTPTVVVGWSHKYREVLGDFGLAELGCDTTQLASTDMIVDLVADVLARREEVSRRIAASLPEVQERSARNFAEITRVVAAHGSPR